MAPGLRRLFSVFILLLPLRHRRASAATVFSDFIYPNFSASSINYIDNGGTFLTSTSSTFSATLTADSPQSPFVFSILHSPTSTVVWSANAAAPAPYTATLSLSAAGLSISLPNGSSFWSTPHLTRPAAALRLLDSGNLLLLDAANVSLWQSFEHPTDTLLSSQRLPAGAFISSPAGDYRLLVTDGDAILSWSSSNQQFWRLSSDLRSVKDLNAAVAYMSANGSGLYLFSAAGRAVFEVSLPPTQLRFVRLESGGLLRVMDYNNGDSLNQSLVAPSGDCELPSSCNSLEVCTTQIQGGATCNCQASFAAARGGGCAPADGSSLFSASSCGGNGVDASYRSLGNGIGYFANKFSTPASTNLSDCRGLCSRNCSCLGFFYQSSSTSCFLIKNQLGSLVSTANNKVFDSGVGYIKVVNSPQPPPDSGGSSSSTSLLPILLPSITAFLLILFLVFAGIQWRRRRRSGSRSTFSSIFLGQKSPSADDGRYSINISDSDEEISIPGLPARFAYTELVTATANFSTKIGSGGFGEVFKGQLPDKSLVAVKRIAAGIGGVRGKKEFCTEIAVIGNIHHVNLVRLRGYSTEGRRRMLVYEYMNRSSLDRSLFGGSGALLEWRERMEIAVGAARGLAYLHSGCDYKIIHCDVKPENILLHDGGGVKISDFGLAKLITPEQSAFFTTMRGTRGYLAPEWLTNSAISDRTDVYSYGMVLLEIVRGRRNRSFGWSSGGGGGGEDRSSSSASGSEDVWYFPMVALEMHEKGRYVQLADPRLEGRVVEEEVGRAVKVALCCLHEDPGMRPTMAVVAAMLDGTMEVALPRPEALGFLRLYGRGFIDYGSSSKGEMPTGTTSSSLLSYYMSSQEVSGPR